VKLQVNNRRLMDLSLTSLGFAESTIRGLVFRLIDKKEKMTQATWEAYAREQGLTPEQVLGLSNLLADRDLWRQSEEMQEFFAAGDAMGIGDYLEYNPAIIRGLDYYTGTVFEARDTSGEFRSILGGGRYDNLVAEVGGGRLPGVGFAMGDVVIGLVLAQYGKTPQIKVAPADVLVTTFSKEEAAASMALARELREAGIPAEWYPAPDRLPKQLKYADALGIRFALILGPDEVREGKVTLKDLSAREQSSFAVRDAVQEVRNRLVASTRG